jgi:hypothetical protein
MRLVLLVSLLAFGLSGCASKYKTDSLYKPTAQLERSAGFYVILARDGSYGHRKYNNSGYMVTQEVAKALSTKNAETMVAEKNEKLEDAFLKARNKGMAYVFEPIIRHWEDRATQWSGIPDKITLQFAVYSAKTEKKLASGTFRASSKWATFGGDRPQDLLPRPTRRFINQLF